MNDISREQLNSASDLHLEASPSPTMLAEPVLDAEYLPVAEHAPGAEKETNAGKEPVAEQEPMVEQAPIAEQPDAGRVLYTESAPVSEQASVAEQAPDAGRELDSEPSPVAEEGPRADQEPTANKEQIAEQEPVAEQELVAEHAPDAERELDVEPEPAAVAEQIPVAASKPDTAPDRHTLNPSDATVQNTGPSASSGGGCADAVVEPGPTISEASPPAGLKGLLGKSFVAGEDPGFYAEVLDGVLNEEKPGSVREAFQVEAIALSAVNERRLQAAREAIWSAAIVEALQVQLANKAYTGFASGEQLSGKLYLYWRDNVERKVSLERAYAIAMQAVSGDLSALAFVERELGAGKVAINASIRLDQTLNRQSLIDRSSMANIRTRENAYRHLDKIKAKRAKKNKNGKKETTPLPSALHVLDSAPSAKERSSSATVCAPKPDDNEKKEPSNSATVFAPKSDNCDNSEGAK